ncbi:MAG: hypothetical protein ACFN04_04770 [Propionibacterium acidifaciens]
MRLETALGEELRYGASWTRPEGVVLPGSYLSATGLSLPSIHPDHLLLVRASALDTDRAPANRTLPTANGGSS